MVDSAREDFFKTVIEERRRPDARVGLSPLERERLDHALKVLANSSSYGMFAEFVRRELGSGREEVRVWGLDGSTFVTKVSAVEEPGQFCFPPLAAVTTAAARLMLALLERLVTDSGGTYAFCDTDSMAIVATKSGGLVAAPCGERRNREGEHALRALSWKQADAIVARFHPLNPYDPDVVPGSILKVENENFREYSRRREHVYAFSISAKRYALFNLAGDGRPILRKWSEHGLGHLLNPTDPDSEDRDWIRQAWDAILREELGLEVPELPWLDRPAVSRLTASSPHFLRPFEDLNDQLPYDEQVKPFNFLLSVQLAAFGCPTGYDPERFQLIAPYESDPRRWLEMDWTDRYSGERFRISISDEWWRKDPA